MRKKHRDVEKQYPRKQFIRTLRRIANSLEREKPFRIQVGKERLYVPGDVVVSIEHEREKQSEELEFQLQWNAGTHVKKS